MVSCMAFLGSVVSMVGASQLLLPCAAPPGLTMPPPPADFGQYVTVPLTTCTSLWCGHLCPWCLLKVTPADHGRVYCAHAAWRELWLAAAHGGTCPSTVMSTTIVGLTQLLLACAVHARLLDPNAGNMLHIRRLQANGILPQERWTQQPETPPAVAVRGGARPAEDQAAGSSGTAWKKGRTKTQWWNDDETAEWRMEPWVKHDPGRRRIIKVRLDGDKWGELTEAGAQELMVFYDTGRLMDVCKGVVTNANGRGYDYRIEDGKYLTQTDPNYRGTRSRECQVLYAGGPPEDQRWG